MDVIPCGLVHWFQFFGETSS